MGFVFIEANVGKWGFAPLEGSLLPPPAYGKFRDTVLLESSRTSMDSNNDDVPISHLMEISRLQTSKIPPYSPYPVQSEPKIDENSSPPPTYDNSSETSV